MAKRRYLTELIIAKLCEAEELLSQGKTDALASKALEITEQSYYRWRREYGEMNKNPAKRLEGLQKENTQLKKLVAVYNQRLVTDFLIAGVEGQIPVDPQRTIEPLALLLRKASFQDHIRFGCALLRLYPFAYPLR